MEKMTFREAQLLVIGALALKGRKAEFVTLNNLQEFNIGDNLRVVEISLEHPAIVVRIADGVESYIGIDNLSDRVVDECIEILRDVAMEVDSGDQRRN